ncbi:WW domain-containing oxidoreductase [Tetrabaena socialis]|uniref:WW domain-containing oxidoreductase n=1 Tax=Tetrabaena socialis TaxID=47790 RepID=A0A2J8AIE1_9CHLO|nr:WW domain-containing oxidoreductase [Tetrabaena socialis]|eukprot:PNH12282.1 WW domain-containing oxidoreductase [Tetrabaena socialis]
MTAGVNRSAVRPGLLAAVGNAVWSAEQMVENALVGWTPNHIPDLSGKVALVTGGNSGIGFEVCRKLVENCATVLRVSRDRERGEAAAQQIRADGGGLSIEVLTADLLSLDEVERLIREVKRRTKATGLHMLLANAGERGGNATPFQPGGYASSPEGLEQTLAVDYYAHVRLVLGLLEELERGAPARVVLQASQAEQFCTLDFNNLKGDKFTDSGMAPYGSSKLWKLMFGDELQRRLRAKGGKAAQIDVFGVHPGLVDSPLMDKADMGRHLNAALIVLQNAVLGMPTWRGSLPALYALTEPRLQGAGFRYIGPNWANTNMLGVRTPGNRLWRTGGPELRARLFDGTVSVLKDVGHMPSHVPKGLVK